MIQTTQTTENVAQQGPQQESESKHAATCKKQPSITAENQHAVKIMKAKSLNTVHNNTKPHFNRQQAKQCSDNPSASKPIKLGTKTTRTKQNKTKPKILAARDKVTRKWPITSPNTKKNDTTEHAQQRKQTTNDRTTYGAN